MEYRQFGTTTFAVSPIGLGCMSMSGAYGPADDAESLATLHRAFDLGLVRAVGARLAGSPNRNGPPS